MFQRIRRWSMDNFSLIQLADNCCPKLFKKIIGVASSDNFFSGEDFEKILHSAVTTGQKFFYQIVNRAGPFYSFCDVENAFRGNLTSPRGA